MNDKFKTPKGTELPLLIMERKKENKKTGKWEVIETPYLQVAHRLVWFREDHPTWTITTEILEWDKQKQWAVFRAHIADEEGRVISQATKGESKAGFADYLEKAETGAIGRALALCGYGTQFAPEFDEGERLADAPIVPAKTAKQPEQPPVDLSDIDFSN